MLNHETMTANKGKIMLGWRRPKMEYIISCREVKKGTNLEDMENL